MVEADSILDCEIIRSFGRANNETFCKDVPGRSIGWHRGDTGRQQRQDCSRADRRGIQDYVQDAVHREASRAPRADLCICDENLAGIGARNQSGRPDIRLASSPL